MNYPVRMTVGGGIEIDVAASAVQLGDAEGQRPLAWD